MLHRRDDDGLTIISQPAHAWISGQLADAWGNEKLDLSPASRALKLAAEQHDIAWLDWEYRPSLNTRTGLPYAFNELPTREHLALWARAAPRALSYGRLPALLISMHGTYLYRRFHDFDADATEESEAARNFLLAEERLQAELFKSLARSGDISQSEIDRQRQLLSLWDAMSLAFCIGFEGSRTFEAVPTSQSEMSLAVEVSDESGSVLRVDPWPFQRPSVWLCCEGRRLEGLFEDDQSLWAAMERAAPVQLRVLLIPHNAAC